MTKRGSSTKQCGVLIEGAAYHCTNRLPCAEHDMTAEGRFNRPGEVGFAGMTTYDCPTHGHVIWCACKKG